jgi:uncharacterized protein (TIGR02265 family)
MTQRRTLTVVGGTQGEPRTGQRLAAVAGTELNTERHLERNLALARPEDTARGMFFNGAVDAVRVLAGEEVAQRCRETSGERKHVDFFSYPVSSFLKMCQAAVREVGPKLGGCEQVLRKIGEQSTRDFLSSMAGKTALLLAGNNVKRLLAQVPSSYRAAVSYGERTILWTGETSGRFTIHHDFMPPAYHEGVLRGVLAAVGVKNIRVRGRLTGPLDSEYEISWESP